eukprot:COSAG06_NODE_15631_length_1057_cov_0.974948_1_plen_65_part_10
MVGVDDALLDEAESTPDSKSAIIQLILQSTRADANVEDPSVAALRHELSKLELGALSRCVNVFCA